MMTQPWVLIPLVLAGAGVWLWDRQNTANEKKDPLKAKGLASRREVTKAAGAKQLLKQASQLRPLLKDATAADLGHVLGRGQGVPVWMGIRDSACVYGGPGSGKTSRVVIPGILDAPGSVVTTATRTDNVTATIEVAKARGPVAVFDPQGLAKGISTTTKWSPIRGCEAPRVAMARAKGLAGKGGEGVEDRSYWIGKAATVIRCLLHAAALADLEPEVVYRWSLSHSQAQQAVVILSNSPKAAPGWDEALAGILSEAGRTRDSIWSMVEQAFAELADPEVMAAVSPAKGEGFDPHSFLSQRGTLYLLGTSTGAAASANLIGALVEDLIEVARGIAATSPNARLPIPLSLILDEAANYPIPSLSALMSEGGGTGVSTMAVWQSMAQARDARGDKAAAALWEAATVKLVLPGMANADDLSDVGRLCGEREEKQVSKNTGGQHGSTSTSTHRVPVLIASLGVV